MHPIQSILPASCLTLLRAKKLLTRQTADLRHWLDSQGDLSTLRLIWCHYLDSWQELIEGLSDEFTDPLLIDFCQRQVDRASVELQQWYLNVDVST